MFSIYEKSFDDIGCFKYHLESASFIYFEQILQQFLFTEVNQIWIQFNKKATINKLWSSSKFALKEPSRSSNYSNAKCHVYL